MSVGVTTDQKQKQTIMHHSLISSELIF